MNRLVVRLVVSRMFTRSQQLSSPLLLPMLASAIAVSAIASIFLLPPVKATFGLQQLFLRAAFDLAIVGCIHVVTVWSIWRLVSEYIEPSAGTLVVHIWAAVVWLPLIATLSAERSLWVSCIVPWAFANAVTFLNLWGQPSEQNEPSACRSRGFLQLDHPAPLWRTLLPYCITVVVVQFGLASLASGHRWSAAALLSAAVGLFLVRNPLVGNIPRSRRRFSKVALLQTALVFFLISTALTPFLQKAYGLGFLASLIATPEHLIPAAPTLASSGIDYSSVILTLPERPHPRMAAPTVSAPTRFSTAVAKPVIIPFDGVYWYFKQPDSRPKPNARVVRGDPIKANVRSTDLRELSMEAHQVLPSPIRGDCCRSIRIDLLNGDVRPGAIRIELLLVDTTGKPNHTVLLGTLPIPSSQLRDIPLNRPPVAESLGFQMPAAARSRSFDELSVIVKSSPERAHAGAKIAIQNFVLVP